MASGKAVAIVLLAGVLMRVVAALCIPLSGLDGPLMLDANSFHRLALHEFRVPNYGFAIDYELYARILGNIYRLVYPSQYTGNLSSVLVYGLFCVVVYRMLHQEGVEHKLVAAAAITFAPAAIFFTSVTLRESWQLLFLSWLCYALLRYGAGHRPRYLVHVTFSALLLGLTHKALIVYSAAIICATSSWVMIRSIQGRSTLALFAGAIATIVLTISAILWLGAEDYPGAGLISGMLDQDMLEQIRGYRALAENDRPRSSFDVVIGTTTYREFFSGFLVVYMKYMFGPALWQAHDIRDVYAGCESIARMMLGIGLIFAYVNGNSAKRMSIIILASVYFSLTLFWALGTVSYGQAVRHHVLTNWLLVLMAGDTLTKWLLQGRDLYQLRKGNTARL